MLHKQGEASHLGPRNLARNLARNLDRRFLPGSCLQGLQETAWPDA